jgi:3-hydroxy-5-methyl-1-naphthoate 3-O-methyltransferase
MVRRHPHLRATVLDLPYVCENGKRFVASEGLTDRVGFAPGDLAKDRIPTGVDGITLIKMAIFDDETTQSILSRFWEALPPGGFVYISSILPNDDETGPIMAMFLCTYHLAVSSGHGRAHTKHDYARWFEKAGFSSLTIESRGLASGLLARK